MFERTTMITAFGLTALGSLLGMVGTVIAGHPEYMVSVSAMSGLLASSAGWMGARPRAAAAARI